MIISVSKEIDYSRLKLRDADEAECQAAGMTGAQAVEHSAARSDWYEAVSIDGELVGVWGYSIPSLFSHQCYAWFLSTPAMDKHKMWLAKTSLRCLRHLFRTYEEIIIEVHIDHKVAREWLNWLCFDPIYHHKGFLIMRAKRSESRWVR